MTSSEQDAHEEPAVLPSLYSITANDPRGELVDRTGLSAPDLAQIDELMGALSRLRMAEKKLAAASQRYMKLNETDMRALHFLIVCENTDVLATPSAIAKSLGISSASTTKLLDRLEHGGHIRRDQHPSDRRALAITIEPATRTVAMRTVGAQHARRINAARRLTPQQRDVVIDFLEDITAELVVDNTEWAEGTAPTAATEPDR